MKKTLIILASAILCTTVCVAAVSSARSVVKAQERKEIRAQKQQQEIEKLKAALAQRTFNFYATSYSFPYKNPILLTSGMQYFLDFYPQDVDIYLPFELNQSPAFTFDTSLQPYTNFQIKESTDKRDPYTYIITAQLRNVSNNGIDITMQNQNINLGLHLSVNIATGNAYLTLTPDFSPAVTYQGIVRN